MTAVCLFIAPINVDNGSMRETMQDPYGRHIEYLRLSVTDRCDLRCHYCMPKGFDDFEPPESWLTLEELERLITVFGQMGVRRVRLTGGEPLVRPGITEIAQAISSVPGIDDLSLSSNGVKLAKFAEPLYQAGVSRLNISLDTLNPDRFREISSGKLQKVIDGLMAAKDAGFTPIKLNMVIMRGINDGEVEEVVDFCLRHGFTLRFIETMPMGETGRNASRYYLSLDKVKERLMKHYTLVPSSMIGGGPADYLQIQGTDLRIGFITPISRHFCESCNRLRLSVEGTLYMCLGQEHSYPLRPLLRDGASDQELTEAITKAIALKPKSHNFCDNPGQVVRVMSKTGG